MRALPFLLPLLAALVAASASAQVAASREAPVPASARPGSGVPLGGLGTGKVEILPDGTFGNLTLNGNPTRPLAELPGSFFALRTRAGEAEAARVLALHSPYRFPTVSGLRYSGGYPSPALRYASEGLPVDVSLRGWSPMVPHNAEESSLPAAVFTFTLSNPDKNPVETTLAFSWENALGREPGAKIVPAARFHAPLQAEGQAQGLRLQAMPASRSDTPLGEYALLAEAEGGRVAALPYWNAAGNGRDFWGFLTGERPEGRWDPRAGDRPAGAVAVRVSVPGGETREVHFVLSWRAGAHVSHSRFKDAPSVAEHALQYRDTLLSGTLEWADLLRKSSLPDWLKDGLANDLFPLASNSIYPEASRFTLMEGLDGAGGRLGALDSLLVSRTPLSVFYPALEGKELEQFARLQRETGEIPRYLGTVEGGFEAAGDAPGSSDAACNYVLVLYRRYRWGGDAEALKAAYPSAARALRWLRARDTDGDGIPEGGATWAGQPQGGSFVYTAGLALAAYRAGEAMAKAAGDRQGEGEFRDLYRTARSSMTAQLWNGRYLTKHLDPATGQGSQALFTAALAGEWAGDALGLPERLDPAVVDRALRTLLESLPSGALAPNEVAMNGDADPALAGTSWPGYLASCLAAPALTRGDADSGLRLLERAAVVRAADPAGPWAASRAYDARSGAPSGPRSDVSVMGSWNAYLALLGAVPDEPGAGLTVAPVLPASWSGLHAPLFTPRYWAWIDYARSPRSAATNLRLKLVKKFDDRPVLLSSLTTAAPAGTTLDDLTLLVSGPGGPAEGRGEIRDGNLHYAFKAPYEWRLGETLEVTLVPPDANNLVLQYNPERVLSYGSTVTARDLAREKQVKFTLVNPQRERQVVNVRFRGLSDKNFEVWQNGAKVGRFTPDTAEERLTLVVPGSPVGFARVDRLRAAAARLRAAGGDAPVSSEAQPHVAALLEKLDRALAADESTRASAVVLHPVGSRLGPLGTKLLGGKKLKEPPPMVIPEDPEPHVSAAEDALRDAPRLFSQVVEDPRARSVVLAALHPVTVTAAALNDPAPGASLRLRVTLRNEGDQAVRAVVNPDLPEGWTGPAVLPRLRLEPGETGSADLTVRLPETLPERRYRIGGQLLLSTEERGSWFAPLDLRLGRAAVREWSLLGAWPAGEAGLDESLPPDTELDPEKSYDGRRWTPVPDGPEVLDLAARFPAAPRALAYALTQVYSPTDRDAVLELSVQGAAQVKLNGDLVLRPSAPPAPGSAVRERVRVRLRQGWNTLLLKLLRTGDSWSLSAEITDPAGGTPEGLRFRAAPW